ncbi:hypothetical protein RRSWK_07177 [Rhodopirellula sp. SWK7]|nr:hypothetical protein RRSWK_07177 [Rhodopirellula sp. SWK7]
MRTEPDAQDVCGRNAFEQGWFGSGGQALAIPAVSVKKRDEQIGTTRSPSNRCH